MECPADIKRYTSAIQEDRVYLFLDGLEDNLDKIRADVLQIKPFPTVEQAYSHVRREAIRQSVMKSNRAYTSCCHGIQKCQDGIPTTTDTPTV